MTSSSNDTRDSINLGLEPPDLFPSEPRWRCYVKAVSPTHLVLTILPASFKDLRALTVSEETLGKTDSHFVNLVKTPMTGDSSSDDLSLESISNIEVMAGPPEEVRPSVPEVLVTSSRRQRSGSDVFEMKRPKLTSMRKHSGDAGLMRDRTSSLDNSSGTSR